MSAEQFVASESPLGVTGLGSGGRALPHVSTSFARSLVEAGAVPRAEGRQLGIAEQVRDVRQPQLPVCEMVADLLDAHPVEQVAEAVFLLLETTLQCADIRAERVGNLPDRSPARGHQQPDRLLDLFSYAALTRAHDRVDQLPCMVGQGRIRSRQRTVEIASLDDDPVEVRAEMHRAVEQPLV